MSVCYVEKNGRLVEFGITTRYFDTSRLIVDGFIDVNERTRRRDVRDIVDYSSYDPEFIYKKSKFTGDTVTFLVLRNYNQYDEDLFGCELVRVNTNNRKRNKIIEMKTAKVAIKNQGARYE